MPSVLMPDNIFGRIPILIPALYKDLVESVIYCICSLCGEKEKKQSNGSVLNYNKQNLVFCCV